MFTAEDTANRALGGSPDRMARWGGAMLLLSAAVTAVMVYARMASDADQGTLLDLFGRWLSIARCTACSAPPGWRRA